MTANNLTGILWMVAACAIAALQVSIIRYLSADIHLFQLIFFCSFGAFLLCCPWALRSGRDSLRTIKKRDMALYSLRALLEFAAIALEFYAITLIPLPIVAAISLLIPIFTVIAAILLLGERATRYSWIALALGTVGALMIIRPGMGATVADLYYGELLMVTAALCWAAANILVKKFTCRYSPRLIVFYTMMMIAALSLPFALAVWVTPAPEQILWIILLGIAFYGVNLTFTNAVAAADMSVVMPFAFTYVIFVAVVAWLVFAENIDLWTLLGAIVITKGGVYATQRKARYLKAE